jgi:hypothetical protein
MSPKAADFLTFQLLAGNSMQHGRNIRSRKNSALKSRISKKEKAFARWHGDDTARQAVYNNRARLKSTVTHLAFQIEGGEGRA